MPHRRIPIAALAGIAVVLVAASGVLILESNAGQSSVPASTSDKTTSLPSEECYQGTVPANSSAPSSGSITVFNITQRFDAWSWPYKSNFSVGSYSFVVTNPGANLVPGYAQLEPQLFFGVTNSQGQTQTDQITDLGNWNGHSRPPDMSLSQSFFGGDLTLQWLFPCSNQDVYLEITAR